MTIRSVVLASVAFTSVGFILPQPSLSNDYAGLADELGNASISILDKLGYDCQKAGAGIVCKKCQVEDNKQECVAYLCDAITRKCRKKSASIPKIPSFNRNSDD